MVDSLPGNIKYLPSPAFSPLNSHVPYFISWYFPKWIIASWILKSGFTSFQAAIKKFICSILWLKVNYLVFGKNF